MFLMIVAMLSMTTMFAEGENMNSVESGLRGGVRYGFNNGLEIGLDMDYGVSKVFDKDEDSHQASAAIVLGYRF